MIRIVNFWFAFDGLSNNKLRAALTTLGIIIGVGAVIMIVSIGAGLRLSTQKQMEAMSGGAIEIQPSRRFVQGFNPGGGNQQQGGSSASSSSTSSNLTSRDLDALRKLATSVVAFAPQFQASGRAVLAGETLSAQIVGSTPDFLTVYQREIKWGRFVTQDDLDSAAPVAVIDESVLNQYFAEDTNPIGQVLHLTVQNEPVNFSVVGVLLKKEGVTGYGPRGIIVPLTSAQLRLNTGARDTISLIAARVDSREAADRTFAVAQINTILRTRRGLATGVAEDFSVRDTMEFSTQMTSVTTTMTAVLSLIAGISLIVGSIGLMNIMLVSVSERTWEIGLRRALGARRTDILTQFLAEAVFLSLAGGLIGLALGVGGSYITSMLVESLNGMVSVTAQVVLIAVGVSMVVGVAAGIYPAWRAALLQPTKALRQL